MYLEACKLGFKNIPLFLPSSLPSSFLQFFSLIPIIIIIIVFLMPTPLGDTSAGARFMETCWRWPMQCCRGYCHWAWELISIVYCRFPLNQSTNQVKWFYLCLLICVWFVFDWIPHLRRTTEVAEGGSRGSTVADVWWRGRDVSKEWIHMTIQHISTFFPPDVSII